MLSFGFLLFCSRFRHSCLSPITLGGDVDHSFAECVEVIRHLRDLLGRRVDGRVGSDSGRHSDQYMPDTGSGVATLSVAHIKDRGGELFICFAVRDGIEARADFRRVRRKTCDDL